MKKIYSLLLCCLCVSEVYSDSHSLRYYYTGISAPGHGLPVFAVFGYMDDQQIQSYTSDIGRTYPVAQWMKDNVGPEYWEKETKINKGEEALFKEEVRITLDRLNLTKGIHFVQILHGCGLKDDGSIEVYQQYRCNGKEFMFLDVQTATFIPTMAEAQITTQRFNSPDIRMGDSEKNNLENICTGTLKRFLDHGRPYLERRVRPGVKVTGRKSGEITKLHCQVYGFHPRAVDVKWMKNGVDDVPSYETTDILPNPDGTYQIRVSVEVMPKEDDTYSCYVDHSSLGAPLLLKWEPNQYFPRAVIIGAAITIILLLTSITVGVLIYRRKDEYTEAGSESSDEEMKNAEKLPSINSP